MELFAPRYYKKFKCIADKCTHSCCVGWEIDIDEETLSLYQQLSGEIGQCIRANVAESEEGAHFVLRPDGKCPHLDDRGLCEIIKTLGEGYLCDICREHPRFYNLVGGHRECGLGAVCEEAARLILSEENYIALEWIEGEKSQKNPQTGVDFDASAWRNALFEALSDDAVPYAQRRIFITEKYAVPAAMSEEKHRALFDSLEYLNEAHRALFVSAYAELMPDQATATLCERFLAYLIYRHASPEKTEKDFRLAVGFSLVLERLFCTLITAHGLAPAESAMIISEELEYSEDNTEAIRFWLELDAL